MSYKSLLENGSYIILIDYPVECPECHNKIIPNFHSYGLSMGCKSLYAFLSCPNPICNKYYVAEYIGSKDGFLFVRIVKGQPKSEVFGKEIVNLSPLFVKIFNESFTAEQLGLLEISGIGFRKSLEFLIKDFLIYQHPEMKEKIEKMFLGKCIAELVEDTRVKETAKRAVWLGNDHTHYIKIWEDKDLSDLKKLIKLTVNWVESEILTSELKESMPDKKI